MPWTDAITPLDGNQAFGVCWDLDNGVFVAAGNASDEAIITSGDGIGWAYQASPLDGGSGYAVARSTPNGVTVAVGRYGPTAIVTSPDDFDWTDRGNPFLGFGAAYGAAIRVSDGAILLAGGDANTSKHLALSTDDGATWSLIEAFDDPALAFCVAVRASDDLLLLGGRAYFSTWNYFATSSDGGTTWVNSKPFGNGGYCWGCTVRAFDGALIAVGSDSSNVAAMAVSTDDGATWTAHQPFGATAGSRAYGVADDTDMFGGLIVVVGHDATSAKQLAYSLDGGSTWTTSAPFGAGGQAFAVYLEPSDWYVSGRGSFGNRQFAVSSDGGSTWGTYQPLGPSGGVGVGLAKKGGGPEFVVSGTNGGTDQVSVNSDFFFSSWTLTSPFGPGRTAGSVAVRASDGLIVVAGLPPSGEFGEDFAETQVAISNDNTATWATYSPFNVPQGQGSAVGCNQSSGVVIAGAASVGYSLARSSDGITFTPESSPFDQGAVGGIGYSPGEARWVVAGAVAGSAVVAYSDDDGLTWTVIATHPMDSSFGVTPSVYRDEENSNWYLLGQTTGGNALAVSSDSGATWTEVATPLDPVAGVGQANAMVKAGGQFALAGLDATGTTQMCSSADGATWELDASTPAPFGNGVAYALAYSEPLDLAVVAGYTI